MAKGKYDSTLNLPQTEFPMRANLPKREPEILKFWQDIDVYKLVRKKTRGRKSSFFMTARLMPMDIST